MCELERGGLLDNLPWSLQSTAVNRYVRNVSLAYSEIVCYIHYQQNQSFFCFVDIFLLSYRNGHTCLVRLSLTYYTVIMVKL